MSRGRVEGMRHKTRKREAKPLGRPKGRTKPSDPWNPNEAHAVDNLAELDWLNEVVDEATTTHEEP